MNSNKFSKKSVWTVILMSLFCFLQLALPAPAHAWYSCGPRDNGGCHDCIYGDSIGPLGSYTQCSLMY